MTVNVSSPARLGAYRLEKLLGRGGMGEVYLAWDERLERHVAINEVRLEHVARIEHASNAVGDEHTLPRIGREYSKPRSR